MAPLATGLSGRRTTLKTAQSCLAAPTIIGITVDSRLHALPNTVRLSLQRWGVGAGPRPGLGPITSAQAPPTPGRPGRAEPRIHIWFLTVGAAISGWRVVALARAELLPSAFIGTVVPATPAGKLPVNHCKIMFSSYCILIPIITSTNQYRCCAALLDI